MILIILLILVVFLLRPRYKKPVIIRGLLTDDECEHISREGRKELNISTVDADRKVDITIRKSKTSWLNNTDSTCKQVIDKCLNYINKPIENCESLQFLEYDVDGFYAPHQDAFSNDKNIRTHTFILALNDDYDGGETSFPNLRKKYKLNKGDVLLFHTLNNYGMITPKALHGGKPVKNGKKNICNLWVHKYPYP